MKKSIVILCSVCGTCVIAVACYFIGYKVSEMKVISGDVQIQMSEPEASGIDINTIAVVNLDEGSTASSEETVYYAERIIQFPSEEFLYTSFEDARQGVQSGNYAAYIIIPSTFSSSIDSLNTTPIQAQLTYSLSPLLSGTAKAETIYQVLSFGESLKSDLSYMYLSNILQEFHTAQDSAEQVMENDQKDLNSILGIEPMDLIQLVSLPDLETEEYELIPLDISDYMNTNKSLIDDAEQDYIEKIKDSQSQLDDIKQNGNTLISELESLSENVDEVNLTTNKSGEKLYSAGLSSLEKALNEFNNDLSTEQTEVAGNLEELNSQISQIEVSLQKSIDDYNSKLMNENSDILDSYLEATIDNLPEVTCEKVEESGEISYVISCSQADGMGAPPVVTLKIVSTESDANVENEAKLECVRKIIDKLISFQGVSETIEIELENVEDPETPIKIQYETLTSVNTALAQCDQEFAEALAACGYANSQELLSDYTAGNIAIEASDMTIEMTGDIAELNQYLRIALENTALSSEEFVVTPFTGNTTDIDNNPTTIQALLSDIATPILDTKKEIEEIETLDVDLAETIVVSECIVPLETRTETVKLTLEQTFLDEVSKINGFKTVIDGYAPKLDQTKISEYIKQMDNNSTELQGEITENSKDYMEFTNDVYTSSNENILALQDHIKEAKDTSDVSVIEGVAQVKSVKEDTSNENQQLLADFSKMLPYTRLGSMQYTQANEFIVNPLIMIPADENN
ncbi:MAG: hypothetical protein ACK5ML_09790 [Lachnospiraceae bacterium]